MKAEGLDRILALTSIDAAPTLLGWMLVRNLPEGVVRGRIVEVEAYHQKDPASHSYGGITKRTEPMFKAGGYIYVYFTYGVHYCVNIVTGKSGTGEAVLIRALEPVSGIEIMCKHRNTNDVHNLANGPGKLTQALGITDNKMSGLKLSRSTLLLEPPKSRINMADILASPRIGIKKATKEHWRFYLSKNPFVSRRTKVPL